MSESSLGSIGTLLKKVDGNNFDSSESTNITANPRQSHVLSDVMSDPLVPESDIDNITPENISKDDGDASFPELSLQLFPLVTPNSSDLISQDVFSINKTDNSNSPTQNLSSKIVEKGEIPLNNPSFSASESGTESSSLGCSVHSSHIIKPFFGNSPSIQYNPGKVNNDYNQNRKKNVVPLMNWKGGQRKNESKSKNFKEVGISHFSYVPNESSSITNPKKVRGQLGFRTYTSQVSNPK
jgi:hypothetical protein